MDDGQTYQLALVSPLVKIFFKNLPTQETSVSEIDCFKNSLESMRKLFFILTTLSFFEITPVTCDEHDVEKENSQYYSNFYFARKTPKSLVIN